MADESLVWASIEEPERAIWMTSAKQKLMLPLWKQKMTEPSFRSRKHLQKDRKSDSK